MMHGASLDNRGDMASPRHIRKAEKIDSVLKKICILEASEGAVPPSI